MKSILRLLATLGILLLLVIISQQRNFRVDLTEEKRFSLLDPTKDLLRSLDETVYVEVYLEGDFPAGFLKLKEAIEDVLEDFDDHAGVKINTKFIDPFKGLDTKEQELIYKDLVDRGLEPISLNVNEGSSNSEKVIFPGAIISYKGAEMPIQLLESQNGYDQFQVLNHSIIALEYKFANAISKLTRYIPPKVVFITGQGELAPMQTSSFKYALEAAGFRVNYLNITEQCKIPDDVDVAIIAKPTKKYREQEKFKIDQFVMNGGSILWLVDQTAMHMDSLQARDSYYPPNLDLNLDDILFRYGVRLNYDLVQDYLCNPIPLVTGMQNGKPQTRLFNWNYFPVFIPEGNHAINKNLDPIMGNFSGTIDTIKHNRIKKTILLTSSENSKAVKNPVEVKLSIALSQQPPEAFPQMDLPIAVLLEGQFESIFKNRMEQAFIKKYEASCQIQYKENSNGKMIVISDGDLVANELASNGEAFPLGFYSKTQQNFANEPFLLNAVEYLIDDHQLLKARNKELKIRLLNQAKINHERIFWQLLNTILPISLIILFALLYHYIRKRKFQA